MLYKQGKMDESSFEWTRRTIFIEYDGALKQTHGNVHDKKPTKTLNSADCKLFLICNALNFAKYSNELKKSGGGQHTKTLLFHYKVSEKA